MAKQTCLFDELAPAPTAVARRVDPWTSHLAASRVTPKLRELQSRVRWLFDVRGAMTQHELIGWYRQAHGDTPESTIRTRVSELVTLGVLRDSGRVQKIGHRTAIIWELVR